MIGAGIFVLPSQLAPYGWTGVAAWGLAIGGALLLAYVIARLSAAMPHSTGIIAITGSALGPLPGLLFGWAYWVGVWCANAVIAITAARYLLVFLPRAMAAPLPTSLLAVALLWLLTILNSRGAGAAGRFQVVTTLLKLLPLLAVILIIVGFALQGGRQFTLSPHADFRAGELTTALTLAFYAMVGFEAAGVAAARVRDPARNVVRATLFGTALTGLIYLVVCTGIIFALPLATLEGSAAPVATFIESFLGRGAGLLVSAFIAVSAIGALNCWVLMQGEVPLGMARAGLLPCWFARVNGRDVGVGVLILSSTLASALILCNAIDGLEGVLTFMLQLTAAASLWVYIGATLAALAMGVARPAALAGLGFALWALYGSGPQAAGLSFLLMLTAVPLYWLRSGGLLEEPAE